MPNKFNNAVVIRSVQDGAFLYIRSGCMARRIHTLPFLIDKKRFLKQQFERVQVHLNRTIIGISITADVDVIEVDFSNKGIKYIINRPAVPVDVLKPNIEAI